MDPRSVTYMVEESALDVSTAATEDHVDYSRTNIQEAGVDEGDIIKTDGTWIYILKQDGSFSIVRANDGAPKVESTTKLEKTGLSNREIREMYLDGDRLIIVEEGICTALEKDNELYRTSTGYQYCRYGTSQIARSQSRSECCDRTDIIRIPEKMVILYISLLLICHILQIPMKRVRLFRV